MHRPPKIDIFRHDANLTFVTLAAVPAPREEEHKRTWPTLHTRARWLMNALTLPENRATAARSRPQIATKRRSLAQATGP